MGLQLQLPPPSHCNVPITNHGWQFCQFNQTTVTTTLTRNTKKVIFANFAKNDIKLFSRPRMAPHSPSNSRYPPTGKWLTQRFRSRIKLLFIANYGRYGPLSDTSVLWSSFDNQQGIFIYPPSQLQAMGTPSLCPSKIVLEFSSKHWVGVFRRTILSDKMLEVQSQTPTILKQNTTAIMPAHKCHPPKLI